MTANGLRWLGLLVWLVLISPLRAADPAFRLYDGADGATCRYFNFGARIEWQHRQGDWADADGQSQGGVSWAKAHVGIGNGNTEIAWNVTRLVRGWMSGTYPNRGILLALVDGPPGASATIVFHSRETEVPRERPRLTIDFGDATPPLTLHPLADSSLDCSTAYSLGAKPELHVGPRTRSVLQFDLAAVGMRTIARATLALTTATNRHDDAMIGVFRLDPPAPPPARPLTSGIAAAHPRDVAIERDPDVIMATGFESPQWRADWSFVNATSHVERVERDDERRFEPLSGFALRVAIPKGSHLGLDMGFNFRDKIGYELDEIWFRYYLRFANDWNPAVADGKLPGVAGTYGKAGWGGRRADPGAGWSMRGLFERAPEASNPLAGRTAIGTYAYHAESAEDYGDHWHWNHDALGLLERNRWYCVEQYFKVNAPGSQDGVLKGWIDGHLAFEKADIRVRDVPAVRIEQVWMNIYHGGTPAAAQDLHLYLDNVVIALKPIGCAAW